MSFARIATSVTAAAFAALITAGCHEDNIQSSSGGSSSTASNSGSISTASNNNTSNSNTGGFTPTPDATTTSTTNTGTAQTSNRYHHYNFDAWHGSGGVALVMCTSTNGMKWCRFESGPKAGQGLRKHGSLDKGREIWTIWDGDSHYGGTIVCSGHARLWKFNIPARGDGLYYGEC